MASPPLPLIVGAQALSAVGEVAGQAASRKLHEHSMLRSATAVTIWSSVQALLVLLILEFAWPALTDGQGPTYLPGIVWKYPGLWLNAVNNTVYWLALLVVLRQPMGATLVVLAFTGAALLVPPFQALTDTPVGTWPSAGAIALACAGVLATVTDVPAAVLNKWPSWCYTPRISNGATQYQPLSTGTAHIQVVPEAGAWGVDEEYEVEPLAGPAPARAHKDSKLMIVVSFAILALTAAIGIVITMYFEHTAGLNSFGYAGIDQIMLPITTLPVIAAACHWHSFAVLLGEPEHSRWSQPHGGFKQLLVASAHLCS